MQQGKRDQPFAAPLKGIAADGHSDPVVKEGCDNLIVSVEVICKPSHQVGTVHSQAFAEGNQDKSCLKLNSRRDY